MVSRSMQLVVGLGMVMSISLLGQQHSSRAFFPDPGFTCCSITPSLVCSITESIIAGIIYPSCPCSINCSLMIRNLDNLEAEPATNQLDSIEQRK